MSQDGRREPVEDFFAREREEIPTLHGDEARWADIVGAARRAPRRSRVGYAAAAAAAVVLVGTAGWGIGAGHRSSVTPVTNPPVTATVLVTATPAPPSTTVQTATSGPRTGAATAPGTTSAPVVGAPAASTVPASFRVISVTTTADGGLHALGSMTCSGVACTGLAASSDHGSTWQLVASFTDLRAPARQSPGEVGTGTTITGVRFATPEIGWVFGGAVKQTRDGGRTWQDYPHQGGAVVDLATDGKDVVLTTADSCDGSVCHGDIRVLRAPASATSATDVAGTIPGGSAVSSAAISFHGGKAFVSPAVMGAGTPPVPQVLRTDGLHSVAASVCTGAAGAPRLVAPAAGPTLFAMCPGGGAAGRVGFDVSASADLGATWQVVQANGPVVANAAVVSFTATDQAHLLAVSGGSTDLHGSMLVSTDAGSTWRTPTGAPPMPDRGWAWVGAPGGADYYALPVDGDGGYWVSRDHGDTWTPVRVAG